ncbi:hypothetical protein MES5069_130077 [Mesorhizobium escarrei]|uniref:Uncharacterized protein n=1 Tax=Mesorhizobium escarrei TaxID=666018 RepID=A0ABM9DHT7_9HYPH|nr:hypothetical protein MES5069_130077 [Mesorhizobium escarrei]
MLQSPVGTGKSEPKPTYVFHDANGSFAPHASHSNGPDRSHQERTSLAPGPKWLRTSNAVHEYMGSYSWRRHDRGGQSDRLRLIFW